LRGINEMNPDAGSGDEVEANKDNKDNKDNKRLTPLTSVCRLGHQPRPLVC